MTRQEFINKIQAICDIGKWTIEDRGFVHNRLSIKLRDGNYIGVANNGFDAAEDRLAFTSEYPSNGQTVSGLKRVMITVSIDKTPERIVKDLNTRFFHAYYTEVEKANVIIAKVQERDRATEQNLAALKAVLPTMRISEDSRHNGTVYIHDQSVYSIEYCTSDRKFTIKTNEITIDKAAKILDILREA